MDDELGDLPELDANMEPIPRDHPAPLLSPIIQDVKLKSTPEKDSNNPPIVDNTSPIERETRSPDRPIETRSADRPSVDNTSPIETRSTDKPTEDGSAAKPLEDRSRPLAGAIDLEELADLPELDDSIDAADLGDAKAVGVAGGKMEMDMDMDMVPRGTVDLLVYAGDYDERRPRWLLSLEKLPLHSCAFVGPYSGKHQHPQEHLSLRQESPNLHRCGSWAETVLAQLLQKSKPTATTVQKRPLILAAAGESIEILQDMSKEALLHPDKIQFHQQWVTLDSINHSKSLSALSFQSYYETLVWRPLPPSKRVSKLAHRAISLSPTCAIARSIPSTFFNRALDLSTPSEDHYFDHILPTVLADAFPPIRE